MVKFWDIQLDKAIKISRRRIKHHEKHGVGKAAMQDKHNLQIQEETKRKRLLK